MAFHKCGEKTTQAQVTSDSVDAIQQAEKDDQRVIQGISSAQEQLLLFFVPWLAYDKKILFKTDSSRVWHFAYKLYSGQSCIHAAQWQHAINTSVL